MMNKGLLSLIFGGVLIGACEQRSAEPTTTSPVAEAQKAAEAPVAAEPKHQHEEGSECGECAGTTTQILHPEVVEKVGPEGQKILHVGMDLAGASEVSVADLLANPDQYAGKTVRVKGNVSAMCKHKRAWFAIVGDDQSGNHVRVFTAPNFLVPQDSIGKSAVAEGTVEIVEIPAERAKHMAEEHKLGEPEEVTGPVKQILVRATGADFS